LAQICTKSFVGWGFDPDPTQGAYRIWPKTRPDPIKPGLNSLSGPARTDRAGKGKEGGEGRGKGGEKKEMEGREFRNVQIESWQAYINLLPVG